MGHWESCHPDCSGNKQKTLHLHYLLDGGDYIWDVGATGLTNFCGEQDIKAESPEEFQKQKQSVICVHIALYQKKFLHTKIIIG